jgi:hypothetical protein
MEVHRLPPLQHRTVATQCDLRDPSIAMMAHLSKSQPPGSDGSSGASDELLLLLAQASRTATRGVGYLTERHFAPAATCRESFSIVDGAALPTSAAADHGFADDNPFGPHGFSDAAVFRSPRSTQSYGELDATIVQSHSSDHSPEQQLQRDEGLESATPGGTFTVPKLPILKGMKNAASNCSLGSWAYVFTPRSPSAAFVAALPPVGGHATASGRPLLLAPTSIYNNGTPDDVSSTTTITQHGGDAMVMSARTDSTFPWSLQSSPLARPVTLDHSRRQRPDTPQSLNSDHVGQRRTRDATRLTPPGTPRAKQQAVLAPTPPRHPNSRRCPMSSASTADVGAATATAAGAAFTCALFVDTDPCGVEEECSSSTGWRWGSRSQWMLRDALSQLLFQNVCFASARIAVVQLAHTAEKWLEKQPAVKRVVHQVDSGLTYLTTTTSNVALQFFVCVATVLHGLPPLLSSWSPIGNMCVFRVNEVAVSFGV